MASGEQITLDFTKLDAPPALNNEAENSLSAVSKTVKVPVSGKELEIYVEETVKKDIAPRFGILFLHGLKYSSKNWLDIKSMSNVANWGYRAVAVDLPGYGKSVNTVAPEENSEFLHSLTRVLDLQRPVIVSPSMSGTFSLPYLFEEPESCQDRSRGYVPVAPIETSKLVANYKQAELPTLVIVGTNDEVPGLREESTTNLMQLPRAQYAPIEGAGHACYLDNQDAFHRLLFFFLQQLSD
ncbi:protein ABHD14B [Aplysia californica]|uniref:Protein ABHD14B n=1 Tax=Aplysia californica TaxID=6500 RepID=A0ABM1VYR5_APLCA|nr:protein ABHD14B [Aplysia californica]XP_035827558.1 protein ABHD14B [Aplysia californica]